MPKELNDSTTDTEITRSLKFKAGEQVRLGEVDYKIDASLGYGTVADVYRAYLDGNEAKPVAAKILRRDRPIGGEESSGLIKEGEIIQTLNAAEDPEWKKSKTVAQRYKQAQATVQKRYIIAGLDSGNIDGVPFVVQELAPPE